MRRAFCLTAFLLASPVAAEEAAWSSKGELSLESRWFPVDEKAPLDAATDDYGVGMFGRAEAGYKNEGWRMKARAFGRADAIDEDRSVLVVEEAWGEYGNDTVKLRLGADILNWTATEAFHPADIINARNLDSDFESLEKLGEPMLAVSVKAGQGRINGYAMPFYTQPILPSQRSRMNFAAGLPTQPTRLQLNTRGEIVADKQHPDSGDFGGQAALQVSQTFGSADIALHVVHHLDRSQPLYVTGPAAGPAGSLLFQTVTQGGLTYQQAAGPVLLKVEAAYRHFYDADTASTGLFLPDRDHAQIAAGIEYTYTHANSFDSTFLCEGQGYAGVSNDLIRRSLGLFQRDLLIGYRLAANDIKDKALMLLVIADLENAGELLASASYGQRLSDVWGFDVSARLLHAPKPEPFKPATGLEALRDSDQVRLSITRYF